MKVSELIEKLNYMKNRHGDVEVETFCEGCTGGMNLHFEPAHPGKYQGTYELEPPVPATIYIGEKWYE